MTRMTDAQANVDVAATLTSYPNGRAVAASAQVWLDEAEVAVRAAAAISHGVEVTNLIG